MSWHQLQNIKNAVFLWRVQIKKCVLHESSFTLSVSKELGKRCHMRGLSSILVIFATSLINSIYKRKILLSYDIKHLAFCHVYATLLYASLHNATKYEVRASPASLRCGP